MSWPCGETPIWRCVNCKRPWFRMRGLVLYCDCGGIKHGATMVQVEVLDAYWDDRAWLLLGGHLNLPFGLSG